MPVGYFDLDVHYLGVEVSPADVETLRGIALERGTEVLYDELDRQGDGAMVHRLLCINEGYQELTIRFREVKLARVPREHRHGRLGWPRRRYVEVPGKSKPMQINV